MAEPDREHFTAKDFLLEQIRELRTANADDVPAIKAEIRALTAYLVVAEMENIANTMERLSAHVQQLLQGEPDVDE